MDFSSVKCTAMFFCYYYKTFKLDHFFSCLLFYIFCHILWNMHKVLLQYLHSKAVICYRHSTVKKKKKKELSCYCKHDLQLKPWNSLSFGPVTVCTYSISLLCTSVSSTLSWSDLTILWIRQGLIIRTCSRNQSGEWIHITYTSSSHQMTLTAAAGITWFLDERLSIIVRCGAECWTLANAKR